MEISWAIEKRGVKSFVIQLSVQLFVRQYKCLPSNSMIVNSRGENEEQSL